jgi:hypothetical protein
VIDASHSRVVAVNFLEDDMKKLISSWKEKAQPFVSIFCVAIVLLFLTACNSGDLRGARPENPPVQMGGNNNPYSLGGDGYTDYNLSPDPKVNHSLNKKTSDASLRSPVNSTLASSAVQKDASDLIYQSDRQKREGGRSQNQNNQPFKKSLSQGNSPNQGGYYSRKSVSEVNSQNSGGFLSKKQAFQADPIPAQPQKVIDRSDPNERILEGIGKQFKEASEFIQEDTGSLTEKSTRR